MEWLLYFSLGGVAGLLAGLFGIGGGSVVVPMLVLIFGLQGFPASVVVHAAIGTSFAVIAVTSLSSILAHYRLGNINWPLWRLMVPGLIVGVVLGAIVATQLNAGSLQLVVALFFALIAVQMFYQLQPKTWIFTQPKWLHFLVATVIGWVSAFIGIGGGSIAVPYFKVCRLPMKNAVGTSAACGLPIAVFGALLYALYEPVKSADIPYLTGFVYWPAFIGIAIASTPAARVGAILASRWPDVLMTKLFSILLLVVSGYLFLSA